MSIIEVEKNKLENELLNPDNHPDAPVVKVAIGGAEVVEDIVEVPHTIKTDIEDEAKKLAIEIGIPGGGV